MAIELLNVDCMEYMKTLPDKAFDLAVVDPPYGINFSTYNRTNKDASGNRFKADKYESSDWDAMAPKGEYFEELIRVSKDQIVWGANYFVQLWQTPCKGFIFWDKMQPVDNFSDGEFAWTSFDVPAKCFRFRYYGNIEGKTSASEKIHPTQKPRELYKWLYKNFAKPGFKILDTHLGSGNSAIVAFHEGFDFVGCEKDKTIYDKAVAHYAKATDGGLFTNAFEKGEGSVGAFLKLFDDEAK